MSPVTSQVHAVDIHVPPELVWQALTDPNLTQLYYFGTRVESEGRVGSPIRYRNAEGGVDVEGEILEIDEPKRLVTTFKPLWAPDLAGLPVSTVTWEITPSDRGTKLTLIHSDFDYSSPGADMFTQAWESTLSELKKVLESR